MRPPIQKAAWNVSEVAAVADVSCDRTAREWHCTPAKQPVVTEVVAACERDSYYCLSERVVAALSERRLIHDGLPPPSARDARTLASALASEGLVVPAEPGYTGDQTLRGALVVGRTPEGRRVLLVGLAGPEISNDHHPYYELLLDADTGQVVGSRRFYWDFAGVEVLEPFWWFGVFTFTVVPLILVLGLARRASRRARATT
jgi:hypothetical protein